MAKRHSIKGRGADVFFEEGSETQSSAQTETGADAPAETGEEKKEELVMVTIYLPAQMADDLNDVWMKLKRRRQNRQLKKWQVVAEALAPFLTRELH